MSDFKIAIEKILDNEGGYVNDKNDAGGATNFGISLRFAKAIYPNWGVDEIKNLSKESAIQIYKEHFWNKGRYGEIMNQRVATYAFDCAVNHGIKQANKFLQRAIMAVDTYPSLVKDDGVIGVVTLSRANSAEIDKLALWCCMKALRANFFRSLAAKNTTQKKFLDGWLKRAYEKL